MIAKLVAVSAARPTDMPSLLYSLVFILITGLPGVLNAVSTVKDLSVLEGGQVTIPCHYNPQYASHVKYWCRGSVKDFCTTQARSDSTHVDSRVSIQDDPTGLVFAVTMRNLTMEDSAWYWCGVEVGGIWQADDTASVYITVKDGVEVVDYMVSAEEAGSVSIQCLYSSKHRTSVKTWCRSADWNSCVTLKDEDTVQVKSVRISDDRLRTVTVTLENLQRSDEGWYRCGAGEQYATVHVTVRPKPPTPTGNLPPLRENITVSSGPDGVVPQAQSQHVWKYLLMILGALVVLAFVVMVTWKLWSQHKIKGETTVETNPMGNLSLVPWDGLQILCNAVTDKQKKNGRGVYNII